MMSQALLKKDLATFINFTHPTILKMAGGKLKMVAAIENEWEQMFSERAKFKIYAITIGEPSAVLTTKANDLQCTIPEQLEIKVPQGRLVKKATLIAVSSDQGKNWVFIDTPKDLQTMRKLIPTLSTELVIPESEQPILYPN